MMNRGMKSLMAALVLATMLPTAQVRAADDSPELTLTMRSQQDSRLRDGAVLGSGRVIYRGSHTGYRVWLNADWNSAAPERYELTGKNNAAHRLKVRLTGEGWEPDTTDSRNGVTIQTDKEQVSVDIVVDGNQEVAADMYVITAQVMAITA